MDWVNVLGQKCQVSTLLQTARIANKWHQLLRSSLFVDVTWHRLVLIYWYFRTCKTVPQPVTNYHCILCNTGKEWRPQLHCSISRKFHTHIVVTTNKWNTFCNVWSSIFTTGAQCLSLFILLPSSLAVSTLSTTYTSPLNQNHV
jgi:hypothetical protein